MPWAFGPYILDGLSWRWPTGAVAALDLRSPDDCGPSTGSEVNIALFLFRGTVPAGYREVATGFRRSQVSLADRQWLQSFFGYLPTDGSVGRIAWERLTVRSEPDGSGPLPIVPEVRSREWRLIVGGESIRSTFRRSSPAYDRLRALQRRVYRGLYQQEQRGDIPTNHHRRWLDYQVAKYALGARYREFIPNDVPDDPPLPHATEVSDDFNRADESLSAGNWTEINGDFEIVSNQVECTGTSGDKVTARFDTDLSGTDQFSQCTADQDVNADEPGAMVRKDSSATQTYYVAQQKILSTFDVSTGVKVVAAVETDIVGAFIGTALPTVVRCEVDGSTITIFSNGVELGSNTDSAIPGNLRCGLAGVMSTGTLTYDTWSAGDLPVASPKVQSNSNDPILEFER